MHGLVYAWGCENRVLFVTLERRGEFGYERFMQPAPNPAPILTTPRLRLCRFGMHHLASFLAYHNDPRVVRFQSWEPFSHEQGLEFVQGQAEQAPFLRGHWTQLAIERVTDAAHIGDVAIHIQNEDPRLAELGVSLAPAHQGKGYAREVLKFLISHVFQDMSVCRISAEIDPRNTASLTLFEALGFVREGHLRRNLWLKGEWVDTVIYGVLADEWKSCAR